MLAASTNPRVARTRSALIAAGFELLAERPIDAIAIDDIVARAGVAKGSFFNHFSDKPGFAQALGNAVRLRLEERVTKANAELADPVLRLAGGLCEAVRFALDERAQAIVMLRGMEAATAPDHALNAGIRADLAGLIAAGLARPEAARGGVRYWLGLCQVAMLDALDRQPEASQLSERVQDLLVLGLAGLGIAEQRARDAAASATARLMDLPGPASSPAAM